MKKYLRSLAAIFLSICMVLGYNSISTIASANDNSTSQAESVTESVIADAATADTEEVQSDNASGLENPFFTAITQVCIVVDDRDKYVKNFEEYGFKDWKFTDFNEDVITDGENFGKPGEVSFLCATNKTCDVELEIIQPVSEGTTYDKFLKEKGPGIHHILVTRGNNYEDTMAFLGSRDVGIQTKATFLEDRPVVGGMSFMYPDTVKDLAMITEFVDTDFTPDDKYDENGKNIANVANQEHPEEEDTDDDDDDAPFFTEITQVCIVVDDRDKYVKNFEEYGFKDWKFTNFNDEVITNGENFGKPSEVSFLCATNKTCGVELEIIQPVSEGTTYDKFLKEKGPGIHHILVTRGHSYEETMDFLESRDVGIQTKATFLESRPVVGGMSFMYPDTVKDLAMITEFVDTDFTPDDKYDESGKNIANVAPDNN